MPTTETKHTPGSWHCGECYENRVYVWNEDETVCIATVNGEDVGLEEFRANRRAVAALPDLLAACLEALRTLNNYTTETPPVGTYNRVARMLGDAIAKTEGK